MTLFALLAGTLTLGSPAPALAVKTWVKGAPVREFPRKGLVVVEFWATWCVPCRDSIPHLTELAKRNRDVTFVGVSVLEDNADRRVQRFVQTMGAKMDYRVGYGGDRDGMARTWLSAADRDAIPTAFIVKDRRIAWIGHPMEMAAPLAQIRAGKLDLAAYRAKVARDRAERAEQQAAAEVLDNAQMQFHPGQRAEAKATLASGVAKHPSLASEAESIEFAWLAEEEPAAWDAKAQASAAGGRKGLGLLGYFAVHEVKNRPDQARRAIELALTTGGEDALVLEYAKEYYDAVGDWAKALDATKGVLAHLDTLKPESRADWRKMAEGWKRNYEAKLKKTG